MSGTALSVRCRADSACRRTRSSRCRRTRARWRLRTSAPRPTTVSTRPPAVTTSSPRARRPGVEHEHVLHASRPTAVPKSAARSARMRDSPREASTTPTCGSGLNAIGAPSSAPSAAAARRGARSSAIIGITTCASGSPNRTLNSITFGPSQVSISPAYRNPRYSCPSARSPATTGSTTSRMMRACIAASTSGLGAKAPIPPVFGPSSPSNDALVVLRGDAAAQRGGRRRSRRRTLRARQAFFEHDARSGVAEQTLLHRGADRERRRSRDRARRRRLYPPQAHRP